MNMNHRRKAIIGRTIVPYDCCHPSKLDYHPSEWLYLGQGYIYSIDDESVQYAVLYHFWKSL